MPFRGKEKINMLKVALKRDISNRELANIFSLENYFTTSVLIAIILGVSALIICTQIIFVRNALWAVFVLFILELGLVIGEYYMIFLSMKFYSKIINIRRELRYAV